MSHCQKKMAVTMTAEWTSGLLWYARMKASMSAQHTAPIVPAHAQFHPFC